MTLHLRICSLADFLKLAPRTDVCMEEMLRAHKGPFTGERHIGIYVILTRFWHAQLAIEFQFSKLRFNIWKNTNFSSSLFLFSYKDYLSTKLKYKRKVITKFQN